MRTTLKGFGIVTLFMFAWQGRADITVGSLVFSNPLVHLQGFEVVNETGPVDGCDAVDAIPVCTILSFQNTSLTVTLSDSSTITRTPSGGFSFAPGSYIYGTNIGDDLNQSFLFDIDPSLSIVSAVFSGVVAPVTGIQVTDGAGESTVTTSGAFSTTLDLSGGVSLAAADITISTQQPNVLPEPGGMRLLIGLLALTICFLRYRGFAGSRSRSL